MLGSFNNTNDQVTCAFAFSQCNDAELLLCLVDPQDCLKFKACIYSSDRSGHSNSAPMLQAKRIILPER